MKENKSDRQNNLGDYKSFLSTNSVLPPHVVDGIKKGQQEGKLNLTKPTDEVMKKYKL
ncbi:hypothetical protein [Pedobacter arcticus]|uniref:hypothetical protein n=1 Tax=Pedobacter arcticus TaxID=752140 RepID=UPI0002EBB413|nr:hypothetical protein [Pedobacter arcticus]